MLTESQRSEANDDHRFRLAMQGSGIGVAIVDLDGRWVELNPAFERILGRDALDLVGRGVADCLHPEDAAQLRARQAALVEAAPVHAGAAPAQPLQLRCLRPDGAPLWSEVDVAVMRDEAGRAGYYVLQAHDITAQLSNARSLHDLNAELAQCVEARDGQLQALQRQQELFSYGISHDLRAPLRAIDNFAGLLAGRATEQLDETGRAYLERIRGAATRMAGIIDALLELSRVSRVQLRPERVDLSLLAEWVGAELADAEPARDADIDVQAGLVAHGDERQLKVLLEQLMHNAWKFSNGRERVRIGVTGEQHEDRVVLSIRDEGLGFDPRFYDKLFEPFQRLHGPDQGGGSGLGLAIAQRVVERHNGRLWAESEPGAGSTFHVELPSTHTTERQG